MRSSRMDEVARRIYRREVSQLWDNFRSKAGTWSGVKGFSAAHDTLKVAIRDPTVENLFVSAANRLDSILGRSGPRYVAIAPVQFGGEFVGHLLHEYALESRRMGAHDRDVGIHPIRKLVGRRFVLDVPQRDHLFVVVDDVKGSGSTFRQILSKHPDPSAVQLIYLAEPGKTEAYRAAKTLAALSYVRRAILEKDPRYLEEMVEKKMNPLPPLHDRIDDRRAWRARDL